MMKRIYPWLLAPILLVLGAGTPVLAEVGTDPASKQEGFECIIDLLDLGDALPSGYTGPTSLAVIPPLSGTTSRLCTGSNPNENIKIHCNTSVPDWQPPGPDETVSASGFTCMIDTDSCDVAGVSGLVQATNSQMSVDADGSASLICHWQP